VKNIDLWQELDKLTQKHNIRWHWIKGHSGHIGNEIADKLANKGIDQL
jgi:ribonuclease HI